MTPNKTQPVEAPAPAPRYTETMRAIFEEFSHHGKPLRGLMSTAKSPSFQGRFGRMFRSLPAATYGKTDAQSRRALMALGKAMTSSFDPPKDGFDAEESGIPALYTYFGLTGIYQSGFEISSLLTCAGGRIVELWVEDAQGTLFMAKLNERFPNEFPTRQTPILGFNYDEQKNTAAWAKLESQPCLEVTLVGQFESKTAGTGGFGNLGAYQYELILVDVLSAKKCEYRSWKILSGH